MSVKVMELNKAVEAISDGVLLAIGGNTLNRAPMAAVYELVRQGRKKLRLVKTAGAMDVDLLCFAGCVESVDAGFVSYESQFSLCRHYRHSVENGLVKANEHACYTVISALRAAAYGLPFMPVKGLVESDLIAANPCFARVKDPFSGGELAVVRAIRPDWAILHVQRADEMGNAQIDGPAYDDLIISRAAKRIMVTTEEIVPPLYFERAGRKADIPHFLVESVSLVPGGAAPCCCYGCYPVDEREVASFLALTDSGMLPGWLAGRRGIAL